MVDGEWVKTGKVWIKIYHTKKKDMLSKSVPVAIQFNLECENGRKAQRVVPLRGRDVDTCLYRVSRQIVESSDLVNKNMWIEEHKVIYDLPLPDEMKLLDVPERSVNYKLS
jgi:hypothetical protein